MRAGVAADLEAARAQFPQLSFIEIAAPPQKTGSHKKCCPEAQLGKNRCGSDQISFAAVIECDDDLPGLRKLQGLADADSVKTRVLQTPHLALEVGGRQHIAAVAGLRLAQLAPRQLQFV